MQLLPINTPVTPLTEADLVNAETLNAQAQALGDTTEFLRAQIATAVATPLSRVLRFTSTGEVGWTVPAGVTQIFVRGWAGGRSGKPLAGQPGGYSGGYAERLVAVTPGQILYVRCGRGGSAGGEFDGGSAATYESTDTYLRQSGNDLFRALAYNSASAALGDYVVPPQAPPADQVSGLSRTTDTAVAGFVIAGASGANAPCGGGFGSRGASLHNTVTGYVEIGAARDVLTTFRRRYTSPYDIPGGQTQGEVLAFPGGGGGSAAQYTRSTADAATSDITLCSRWSGGGSGALELYY